MAHEVHDADRRLEHVSRRTRDATTNGFVTIVRIVSGGECMDYSQLELVLSE